MCIRDRVKFCDEWSDHNFGQPTQIIPFQSCFRAQSNAGNDLNLAPGGGRLAHHWKNHLRTQPPACFLVNKSAHQIMLSPSSSLKKFMKRYWRDEIWHSNASQASCMRSPRCLRPTSILFVSNVLHTLPAAQPNDRKQAALHNPYLKFFHLKIST